MAQSSPSASPTIAGSKPAGLVGRWLAAGVFAAAATIALMSGTKIHYGMAYLILPEMGSLAYGVFTHPGGAWARAPLQLVLMPSLVAIVGTLIARNLPYGYVSILLAVGLGILVLRSCRSPIAPAISCGLLPVVFDLKDWWYPINVLTTTLVLMLALSIWQRLPAVAARSCSLGPKPPRPAPGHNAREPVIPGLIGLAVFLVLAVSLVKATDLRLLLVPPLGVLAVEMFKHPRTVPWANRPLWLIPLVCCLSAGVGVAAFEMLPLGPLVAATAICGTGVILWAFRIYLPPAVAISMLPLVMTGAPPTIFFPLWVGLGVAFFTLCIAAYRHLIERRLPTERSWHRQE